MRLDESLPRPPLSLLIPTYGRPLLIWDTARALLNQFRGDDELVIVDQNHPPLQVPSDCEVTSLRLLRQEIPGLTRARNLALSSARHASILFLDDDIIPAQDLLQRFREAVAMDSHCVWAGAVDQDDIPEFQGVGFVDLNSGEIRTRFDFHKEGDLPFFSGCHALLPRKALPDPPVFCEHFRGNAQGEEIDLALRLKKRGIRIRALPKARVHHLKIPAGGCRTDAYRRRFHLDFCYNEGLFFGRHGRLGKLPNFFSRIKGFLEFHTRKKQGGHSVLQVMAGVYQMAAGLCRGISARPALKSEAKPGLRKANG